MSASYLAELTQFPQPTIAKILKILSGAEIISSTRGKEGGYTYEKDSLTLKEIIEAMEGPIAITTCADKESHECSLGNVCVANGRWAPVNSAIKIALEEVTLSDMVATQYGHTNKSKDNKKGEAA